MSWRLLKFVIAGGSAAVVEYGIFIAMQSQLSDSWIVLSQAVSFLCGFIVSFLLNKTWVFKSDGSSKKELVRYAALAAVNLALSSVVLWLMVSFVGIIFWISKIAVMVMVAAWNYLIFQKIIFNSK